MRAFPVFTKKNRNFKHRNSKTELQSEIIKIKIIEIQAYLVLKQIFLLCLQQACLFAVNWLSHKLPTVLTNLIKNTH